MRGPARARRDDGIKALITGVYAVSFGLHGTRKIWHQLHRDGTKVAQVRKRTIERLMRAMGLTGVRRRHPPQID